MDQIGIVGYGNLGRGAEAALGLAPDMALAAVFTRRDPAGVDIRTPEVPVLPYEALGDWAERLDGVVLCGGSSADLPRMTPEVAALCNVVDSFDTHADIPAHFDRVDRAARNAGKLAVISAGWDPGLFSLSRLYAEAALPRGGSYTFWGRGVSQGHSDAIRRIPGVRDARQYTVPVPRAVERVRAGEAPELTTREKHTRECYVVAEEGADQAAIERAIVTMPHYFEEYDTTVTFVTQAQLDRDHRGLPHGGSVIRSGTTGWAGEHRQTVECRLALDSNPEFTGSVLVACMRACCRLNAQGRTGCLTMLDIPPAALSPLTGEELRERLV